MHKIPDTKQQTNLLMTDYIEQHLPKEADYLARITRDTYLNQLNPHMLSGHIQGRLLSMLSCLVAPMRILELGTFTGYSALCLAEGLQDKKDAQVITIEHNDELEESILRNIAGSPYSEHIHVIIGDALEILEKKKNEWKEYFDLIFIDADKRQYCEYFEAILPMLSKHGLIIADNTLWDGHVADSQYDNDRQTIGLRRFNDMIAHTPSLCSAIIPVRDGLTLIMRQE